MGIPFQESPHMNQNKFNTRYCVQGDQQEDTPETYAPVVSWSTIRLVPVFTLTQSWHLICMDFSNAFVKADLKDPVWIHFPRGYKSKTTTPTCLQLKKSLYGLSVAPKL